MGTRGWHRPERAHRRREPKCHRRALAHSGNARDAGRWRRACRRTDRGAHSFCRGANELFVETERGANISRRKRKTTPAEVTSEGTRNRALEAMSDTTPWWERPSTQPADGGDEGCSISTSVTVRLRLQDTLQFRSPERVYRLPLRPSRLTLTLSSPPRSTRARPRLTKTA